MIAGFLYFKLQTFFSLNHEGMRLAGCSPACPFSEDEGLTTRALGNEDDEDVVRHYNEVNAIPVDRLRKESRYASRVCFDIKHILAS